MEAEKNYWHLDKKEKKALCQVIWRNEKFLWQGQPYL